MPAKPFAMSERMKKVSRHYLPAAETVSRFFPELEMKLQQAEFASSAKEWVAFAILAFTNLFTMAAGGVFLVSLIAKVEVIRAILVALGTGIFAGLLASLYILFYPKLLVARKVKALEDNLPYAMRHLLIQVRGGMPLYNSMVSISMADYGVLSAEFRKAVKQINTGMSEIEALERLTRSNPSLYFRRVMWQLLNALKTGSDIGVTLNEIVDSIIVDQKAEIKKYGSQLNPLALMYMLLVVIFPTLGIVFLLIMTGFVGNVINIQFVLMMVIGFLILFQFIFIGIIKSKRPVGL
ncbi:MAG: type II secretion system F family protein [Candidatus Aenigmarchaeota archaeon]|nr:type II secretion system F family protein [Candidatus Aenigmarchaeota archaeon]